MEILFSFTGGTALLQLILLVTNFIPESPVSSYKKDKSKKPKKLLLCFILAMFWKKF